MASGSTASRRSNLQIVIIGDVTVGAGINFASRCILVKILERKSRGVVIPGRSPIGGGVTGGTLGGWKSSRDVIGNGAAHCGGVVVFILMAAVATGVRGGEIVVVVEVAIGAWSGSVNSRESPTSGAV